MNLQERIRQTNQTIANVGTDGGFYILKNKTKQKKLNTIQCRHTHTHLLGPEYNRAVE